MSHNRKKVRQGFNELPEPVGDQQVARVTDPRGSNQVEVELPDGEKRLVIIPSKFHKVVFLKHGDFVIVQMEANQRLEESKVVGSIICPLHSHQVKHLAQKNLLPPRFVDAVGGLGQKKSSLSEFLPPEDDEDEDELLGGGGNLNRRQVVEDSDSD